MPFALKSTAFAEGDTIPLDHTCHGHDRSPPLEWSGAPEGTRFYALVMDDPDAPRGTWTHWTWWDLPATVTTIPPGADVTKFGATQGLTSARAVGYHGPCPPSGEHRYIFTLHATAEPLKLPRGASVEDVHRALKAKSIGSACLLGKYEKS